MLIQFGDFLLDKFGKVVPVSFLVAFLDLLVNTALNIAFRGYNNIKIRSKYRGLG